MAFVVKASKDLFCQLFAMIVRVASWVKTLFCWWKRKKVAQKARKLNETRLRSVLVSQKRNTLWTATRWKNFLGRNLGVGKMIWFQAPYSETSEPKSEKVTRSKVRTRRHAYQVISSGPIPGTKGNFCKKRELNIWTWKKSTSKKQQKM